MKTIIVFITVSLMLLSTLCYAAKQAVWSVNENCPGPESAFYDKDTNAIYVSCQAGPGDLKDGKGWLIKVSTDGKVISEKWIEGLNAPKGIASHGNVLWVSDIDEVIKIDKKSGKVLNRIEIKGAKYLNDVATGPTGVVYVSDTIGSSIYRIVDDKPAIFMSGVELESPNGLYLDDGKIYVAPWGRGLAKDWSTTVSGGLYSIDIESKKIDRITKKPLGNLDGIELDKDGAFIVSDWMTGKVYSITKKGKVRFIYQGKKGLGDIGYIPSLNYVLLPQAFEGVVSAIK